ncbi:glycerol-3-phosphate dehydrogenase, partial [Pseudomonas syringae pv. tagetis]
TVFGGKLTTYPKQPETAKSQLAPFYKQKKPSWTAKAALPRGEDMTTPEALAAEMTPRFSCLPTPIDKRWSLPDVTRSRTE